MSDHVCQFRPREICANCTDTKSRQKWIDDPMTYRFQIPVCALCGEEWVGETVSVCEDCLAVEMTEVASC